MSKKYTKEELLKMPAVEIYKLVLRREISRFPTGFWMQPEALENAKLCTKFMIEEILEYTDEDIKNKINVNVFRQYKLSGMLQYVFNNSPYDTIDEVYPNRFKPWEFKNVPICFWTLETGIESAKWLLEEKLKWTDEDIKEKLSQKTFIDNNLRGMLQQVFNGSPFKTINKVYPNRFKQWEFKSVPMDFWTLETGTEATKWLIKQKLKWTDKDIKEKISTKIFRKNNLNGMLQHVFGNSPYNAINATYPNKLKQWELKSSVPRNYWTLENGIEATKWLIEEKLKWTNEDIKENLSTKTFRESKLDAMLQAVFNHSPYDAINAIYPDKFKKEDLKSYQYNFIKNK